MITVFKNAKDVNPYNNIDVETALSDIKNGKYADQILDYFANRIPKTSLPAVTFSGQFSSRNAKNLIQHSGLLVLDLDSKDQLHEINFESIKSDPYTFAAYESVSKNGGYAVLIKINPVKHLESFMGLEKYYFDNYQIILDVSGKDVSRLRFVSYDPNLYHNPKSKVFKEYLPKKEVEKVNFVPIFVKSDFDQMVNQAASMNLFEDYSDYIKCSFAIASKFGSSGENYFHQLCQGSEKYNQEKASKQYAIACKRQGSITIGTLYHIFKEAGIETVSKNTKVIRDAVKISKTKQEAEKILESQGATDTDNVLDSLFKGDSDSLSEVDKIKLLLTSKNLKLNEISRHIEIDGEPINDALFAKLVVEVWDRISDRISESKIKNILTSSYKQYNPIRDYFQSVKNLPYNDEFETFKECFVLSTDEQRLFIEVFVFKWLLGIVASAHGTYSLLILVLNGEQGTNKTEFFRNLLPAPLRLYYAENNLDEGKDSEILLTKKLLIIDDEFGGKSKKDANKMKRLSSQQWFSVRAPYGRFSEDLQRLAVLGGTSNDPEVINDLTGNRRIIPLNIIELDIEKFKSIDKDALFGYLYRTWEENPSCFMLSKVEIEALNELTDGQNLETVAEIEILNSFFEPSNFNTMTNTEVYKDMMIVFPHLKTSSKKIGMALKKCGFLQKVEKINGKTSRNYQIQLKT